MRLVRENFKQRHKDLLKKFALEIIDSDIIKFGKFKLKLHEKNPDAPLSPIYIDFGLLRSDPVLLEMSAEVLDSTIYSKKIYCHYLSDIPTRITPVVSVLSLKTRVPMITPRLDKKKYGSGNKIDGFFFRGKVSLLIDDVLTKAHSKFEAISILEGNGVVVTDVLVLIDREQGGVQELEKVGYNVHSVYKLKELLEFYWIEDKISERNYHETLRYLERN